MDGISVVEEYNHRTNDVKNLGLKKWKDWIEMEWDGEGCVFWSWGEGGYQQLYRNIALIILKHYNLWD